MVEFSLPANSKVTKGIKHRSKTLSKKPKNLIIYDNFFYIYKYSIELLQELIDSDNVEDMKTAFEKRILKKVRMNHIKPKRYQQIIKKLDE